MISNNTEGNRYHDEDGKFASAPNSGEAKTDVANKREKTSNNFFKKTSPKEANTVTQLKKENPELKAKLKGTIRMFELIQSSGETSNLFKILDSVVDLSKEERAEMADLLEKTELSHIIEMLNLVVARLQAINDFETLIFNKDRYTNEVDHVQKFIEQHYWFFGEQYHLATAEEPNFEEALRAYLNFASDHFYKKGEIHIENDDKNKQMDIFAIQSIMTGEVKKCIVVELKRPSVTLSSKELGQIKKYYGVIKSDSRFQSDKIKWDFILVGNEYNDEIEGEINNSRHHGIYNCVYKVKNCTIVVKTWSDILTELKMNMHYLEEKLKVELFKTLR